MRFEVGHHIAARLIAQGTMKNTFPISANKFNVKIRAFPKGDECVVSQYTVSLEGDDILPRGVRPESTFRQISASHLEMHANYL